MTTHEEYLAEQLKDDDFAINYLKFALEESHDLFNVALVQCVKARGLQL